MLKARAQSDEDSDVRQTAVQELTRRWKNDSDVQRFLKALRERPVEGRSS